MGVFYILRSHSYSSNRIKVMSHYGRMESFLYGSARLNRFTPEVSQWFIESITSHEDITGQVREKSGVFMC